ncbi:MAG: methyltransferase domain-containing protein [Magnetococcales bacterium]|nr:methyltransferase domain-containing protein [Magnetococcales bacterium]
MTKNCIDGNKNCEDEWESRYLSGQIGWDRGQVSPSILALLNDENFTPCRILIPGCGQGYEVALLAERGFDVTAIDFAPSAIKVVRGLLAQQGLKATVVQADFFNWQPDTPVDAIYEQTSLCALHPDRWQAYEELLRLWLKPGGRLFANFMQTNQPGGPPYHCSIDEMHKLFNSANWIWQNSPLKQIDHPSGKHELATVLTHKQ